MQTDLNLNARTKQEDFTIEKYQFEPIKGYPMPQWQGKRPFTSTQFYPAQLKETYGEETDGWMNQIFWGDNLQVMSHLLKKFRGQVDLIYIDPPFDSKADYKKTIKLRSKTIANNSTAFEEKQYTDIWTNDEYLQFIYERFVLLREILSDNGAIVVHVDWHQVHRIRLILDEIFGEVNFRNEIIWHYGQRTAVRDKKFDSKHDNLLFYAKSDNAKIYTSTVEWKYEDFIQHRHDVLKDENGKEYVLTDGGLGRERYRRYVDDIIAAGKPLDTVWDMPLLNSSDKQRQGYPTQKPDYLIERLVNSLSKPGDIIFDCFMGSGTTQAVAMKLGRRFLGADINLGAIQTTTKRLIKVANELSGKVNDGAVYTGFQLYNVNHYDLFHFRSEVEAKELLMKALEIEPAPGGGLFDGEKDGRLVKVMPVNRIATRADLNEILSNIDLKAYEKKKAETPNRPAEQITLVCMGHEPDLAAQLKNEIKAMGYTVDVEVVDVLRDRSKLEFKRDAEAEISIENNQLLIREFYPMNLLQKLSLMKEDVGNWKELVESVLIDWNYDGAVLEPTTVDIPEGSNLVRGVYPVPGNHGTIRVKVTDLLSESLEQTVTIY